MHPLFYKLNTRHNVVFTKHCKQRLLQRFKLFLLSFERENPEIYLKKLSGNLEKYIYNSEL